MPDWLSNVLQNMLDFSYVLNTSIAASWLILVVMVLRLVLKKAPKCILVALWGLVALRILMPVSIESPFSLLPSAQTVSDQLLQAGPVPGSESAYLDIVTNPSYGSMITVELDHTISAFQWDIILFTIPWLIGMTLMTLYAGISYWRVRRKVATAVILRDRVFRSENIGSPFVLGILRPRIYLPYGLDEQSIAHVIAHEQAHICRKDHWWKPLGFLLLTIHWFNPLIWIAYILLCRDIELACDEKVIASLGSEQRADYSQALLSCSGNRTMIAACPLAFGELGVKERVKNVMNYRKPTFWVVLIAVILCITVALCFLTDPARVEAPIIDDPNSQNFILNAHIIEINEGYFLVQPVPGSRELNSASLIEVSKKNMEPSPEPQLGDVICIEYNGQLLETYPARIHEVYRISVVETFTRMINCSGIIYVDTGETIPAEIDPSAVLGTLHTQVEGRPSNHGQANFSCVGCEYARVEDGMAVLIDHEWYLFTEFVQPYPEYYLTIGNESAVSIEIRAGSRVQLVCKDDLSAYEQGEAVLLPVLTGKENLRGVTITVRDADNHDIFSVSISAKEHGTADEVIECGEWIITPVSSEADALGLNIQTESSYNKENDVLFTVHNDPDLTIRQEQCATYILSEEEASFVLDLFHNHEYRIIDSPIESIGTLEFQCGNDYLLTCFGSTELLHGRIGEHLIIMDLTEAEAEELREIILNVILEQKPAVLRKW